MRATGSLVEGISKAWKLCCEVGSPGQATEAERQGGLWGPGLLGWGCVKWHSFPPNGVPVEFGGAPGPVELVLLVPFKSAISGAVGESRYA
jgi:hypothetical protein